MNVCKEPSCDRVVKSKGLCGTHYNREWVALNKEKVAESKRKWGQANKDKRLGYNKTWRDKNPDKVRQYARGYMAKNSKKQITIEHITENVITRFYNKVDKTDTCWNWTGAKTANRPKRAMSDAKPGYGYINISNRPFYTHRLAMLIKQGYLTEGLVVDHMCNNTLCVNPDHLQEIDNLSNVKRSPLSTHNGARYYKTHCKYGHERTEDMRGKPCKECYGPSKDYNGH